MGSDHTPPMPQKKRCTFQSTLPVWGATVQYGTITVIEGFQSTLPVWGATKRVFVTPNTMQISIHAPRVGSDKLRR